jgi:hypothetical protein
VTSLGEEHNPYAAPQSELQLQGVHSRPAAFHPMSPRKAAVMSALTFNIYDLVFWYRHWMRLKESGQDVTPVFRALFAGFTSFSFLTTLCTARAARGLESGSSLRATPGLYLGLNLGARVSEKILEGVPSLAITMLACAGCAWVLATIQRGANEVLAADNYQGPSNSGANLGAIAACALGLVFWLGAIVDTVSPESLE